MGNQCCRESTSNRAIPETIECPAQTEVAQLQWETELLEENARVHTVANFQSHHTLPKGKAPKTVVLATFSDPGQPSISLRIPEEPPMNPVSESDCKESEKENDTDNDKDKDKISHQEPHTPLSVHSAKSDVPSPRHNRGSVLVDISDFICEKYTALEARYEIMSTLGRGSFGEVKQVRDRQSGQLLAAKIISKGHCQITDTYLDEITILKKLVRRPRYHNAGPSSCAAVI